MFAEPRDLLILRRFDADNGAIMIDDEIFSVGDGRSLFPLRVNAFGFVAAVNRIYDDSLVDRSLAGVGIVNRPLGEWLIAGDEDDLVDIRARTPFQFVYRVFDDPTAKFLAAIRL